MSKMTAGLASLGGFAGLAFLIYIGMWVQRVESRLADHERRLADPIRYENTRDCPRGSELVSREDNLQGIQSVWCRDLTP